MAGVYYDPGAGKLRVGDGPVERHWIFLTHDLRASRRHCERILAEVLPGRWRDADFSELGSAQ